MPQFLVIMELIIFTLILNCIKRLDLDSKDGLQVVKWDHKASILQSKKIHEYCEAPVKNMPIVILKNHVTIN